MKTFIIVCMVIAVALAGPVKEARDKRSHGWDVEHGWQGDWGHHVPQTKVITVQKLVHVPREITVPQVVHVRKVITEPKIITIKKVVPVHTEHAHHGWW